MEAKIGGERFSFERVAEALGARAATALAMAWQSSAVTYATGSWKAWGHGFCRFVLWLQDEAKAGDERAISLVDSFAKLPDAAPESDALRSAIERWRDRPPTSVELASKTPPQVARQRSLQQVLSAFRLLASANLLPPVRSVAPALRGQIQGNNIPSLAELVRPGEVPPTEWRQLVQLNEVRLERLRELCVGVLENELARVRSGRALAANVKQPAKDEHELSKRLKSLGFERDWETGRQSGRPSSAAMQAGLAEALAFYSERHSGVVDPAKLQILRRRLQYVSPDIPLRHHLGGTPVALLAAQFVVLIDTGLNVGVLEDVAAQPFVGTTKRGHVQLDIISAVKLRAGGRVIEGHLASDTWVSVKRVDGQMSGRQAIEAWLELSAPARERAKRLADPVAEFLWLVATRFQGGERIILIPPESHSLYLRQLRELLKDDPIIGGLDFQRRMIRPTYLQIQHARGGYDQLATAAVAGHSRPQTTEKYVGRQWLRAVLDEQIRKFLDLFEVTLASDVKEVRERIGLTAEDWDARRAASFDTGIGFLCTTPRSSPQPTATDGDRCLLVDRCASCPSRKFVPSDASIRDLVILRRSITQQQVEFEAANPARWSTAWLPLFAIVEAIVSKLALGAHKFKLQKAEKQVDEDLLNGSATLVRLY